MTYEQAVERLCTVIFLDWDHDDPLGTLDKLIQVEVDMALDPKISTKAVDLIKRHGGKMKRCATCKHEKDLICTAGGKCTGHSAWEAKQGGDR